MSDSWGMRLTVRAFDSPYITYEARHRPAAGDRPEFGTGRLLKHPTWRKPNMCFQATGQPYPDPSCLASILPWLLFTMVLKFVYPGHKEKAASSQSSAGLVTVSSPSKSHLAPWCQPVLFTDVSVSVSVCEDTCTCLCRGPKLTMSVFFNHPPL